MEIQIDHVMVPARDKAASAARLAAILGVPSGPAGAGPFHAVYVNAGLTLDFVEAEGPATVHHYCFRVDDEAFDAILGRIRAAGIPYKSTPHGPADMQVNTSVGGRIVYWNEPAGHMWEILTQSYARQPDGR